MTYRNICMKANIIKTITLKGGVNNIVYKQKIIK